MKYILKLKNIFVKHPIKIVMYAYVKKDIIIHFQGAYLTINIYINVKIVMNPLEQFSIKMVLFQLIEIITLEYLKMKKNLKKKKY